MEYCIEEYFQLNEKPDLAIGVNLNTKKLGEIADWVKTEHLVPLVHINRNISKLLLGKSIAGFSKEIVGWFSEKLKETNPSPILFKEIEILFEPSFTLDPLAIFKQVSRNTSLLVMWPGEYKNSILSYASPEHTHYRTWANPGVEIIQI